MNILKNKSNIDHKKLKQKINIIVANELDKLSEPCYIPSMQKYYFELLYFR